MTADINLNARQQVDNYLDLLERGAPKEQITRAEEQLANTLNIRPYQLQQRLPFFQKIARALDAGRSFNTLKLPSGRVIEDKREGAKNAEKNQSREAGKRAVRNSATRDAAGKVRDDAARSSREAAKDEGREAVRDKAKAEGSRANSSVISKGGLEREVATHRFEKLMSQFEKMLVQRFENGKQIAGQSADGKPTFNAKSEAQWKAFFQRFFSRTVKKSVRLSDIANMLFRGMVSKGGKGVFIGDMQLKNGRMEKFVRFSILADIIASFKGLKPGQQIGKGMLEGLSGEELMYLALAASKDKRLNFTERAELGKFMGGKAEELAAKQLGITLDDQLREKAKRLRNRGKNSFGGFFDKDAELEDIPYRFVPWWHWGNLSKPGKFKWTTVFFYGSLLAMAILGAAVATMRILGG